MFQKTFRTAHISAKILSLKKKKFHRLRQKNRSVSEYIKIFNQLSRYTPNDINTDAKRKKKLLNDLNDELSVQLTITYTPTYQSLINKTIILKNKLTHKTTAPVKEFDLCTLILIPESTH
ncbi:hypothetical protein EHS16_03110 [Streptococcus anginosus]|nr:hypothetical protein EHS16_03110 [Streptococcus anginosus]